ncbi:CHAD domain-containing protein [Fulvimarina sp. MAC8]|uniref:CHAD domain-containing protein n=1 Tax=Fulvimarina sp. MAC8 TaxID=3162874 RepID=UPI0032EF9124
MSYAIEPGCHLGAEIQRIAVEQIEKAEKSLNGAGEEPHEAIHDARKRLKKLRGLIRLIRPEMGDFYKAQNALFRNTAKKLSGMRDKAALVEAIEKLEERFSGEIETDALGQAKTKLVADRDAEIESGAKDAPRQIEETLHALEKARRAFSRCRFEGTKPKPKRDSKIAAAGLEKTYGRAREALKIARKSREAEDLHELRKRVKYHWMHLRLLKELWPEGFTPAIDAAKQIADDLGDDHDLAVMRAEMEADPKSFGEKENLSILLALIDRRQAELRERALNLAAILLAEKPAAIEARIRKLYKLAARRAKRPSALPPTEPAAQLRVAEE